MNPLNIWIIQTGEILPLNSASVKMRTGILAEKLCQKGHKVLWWASAFDHMKKEWLFEKNTRIKVRDGLEVFALKGTGYKANVSLSRYIDHRLIAKIFKKEASKLEMPDIIVASTPPYDLAFEAAVYAGKHNIPILIDIRDKWPDIFFEQAPPLLRNILKALLFMDIRMTKSALNNATGLLAVSESFLDWGLKYIERARSAQDRVFHIGYMRRKDVVEAEKDEKLSKLFMLLKDKFTLCYIGTISKKYHNPLIIPKAAKILKDNKDIFFVVAGDGEAFDELSRLSKPLDNVFLAGWLNQAEIDFVLRNSDAGLCPSDKFLDFPTNKAYSYLSAGLPLVSSFQGELKDIIENNEIGLNYPPDDLNALVGCIKRLYQDKELYEKMSGNANRLFEEMFDADKIYEEFAQHIERVAVEYRAR